MVAKGFKNMFQDQLKFKVFWKGLASNRNERNSKGKFASKVDTSQNTCYGCGLSCHMIKDVRTSK